MVTCWINLSFWETAHQAPPPPPPPPPPTQLNVNNCVSPGAKYWVRGGVGWQFPRNLNWSDLLKSHYKVILILSPKV